MVLLEKYHFFRYNANYEGDLMFIDTHCHLGKKDYEEINKVIQANKEAGVPLIVISGCNKEDMEETLQLANQYQEVYATIGYHPEEAEMITKEDLKSLEEKLSCQKVIGIGEIGLDYHYRKDNKNKQQELFQNQLELAIKYHLPVVIHSRDATEDTINILKKYKVKGIMHCFSGSIETAKIYIRLGFYLGIGGVVTFKNSNLKKTLEEIPLEKIVLETDSPYLAPEPYRGTQNSSKNIPIIASTIAAVKKVSLEEVEKITSHNAKTLFNL